MIVILTIIVIILLLLLYFNYKNTKQVEVDRQAEREVYQDSLKKHHIIQDDLKNEIKVAVQSKTEQLQKDSIAKYNYQKKIKRLEHQVEVARTQHVDSLIEAEPELKSFIIAQETVISSQALRIDSLEVEKRIQQEMNDYISSKQNSLLIATQGERDFLVGEVDKRDKDIDKLEKKLKRARRWAAFFGLLNLVPRGGNY